MSSLLQPLPSQPHSKDDYKDLGHLPAAELGSLLRKLCMLFQLFKARRLSLERNLLEFTF